MFWFCSISLCLCLLFRCSCTSKLYLSSQHSLNTTSTTSNVNTMSRRVIWCAIISYRFFILPISRVITTCTYGYYFSILIHLPRISSLIKGFGKAAQLINIDFCCLLANKWRQFSYIWCLDKYLSQDIRLHFNLSIAKFQYILGE